MKVRNTKTPPKGNRARKAKPSKAKPTYTVINPGEPTEAEKKAQEEHVAKLVKLGRVTRGTGGPPIAEILRPGPRCKGDAQKALRWARGDDA